MSDSEQPHDAANDDDPPTDPEIIELLKFDPAPRKVKRPDGWTPELQRRFIQLIVETGSPQRAAWAMQKSLSGVQEVYRSAGAEGFCAAWHQAVEMAADREQARLSAMPVEAIADPPNWRGKVGHAPSPASPSASPPSPAVGGKGGPEDQKWD